MQAKMRTEKEVRGINPDRQSLGVQVTWKGAGKSLVMLKVQVVAINRLECCLSLNNISTIQRF